MRAVLYSRVSDSSQVDTWSLGAQRSEFERHCAFKGWQSVGIYSDEGRSARSDSIDKRPEFKRLLNDCKKGNFEVIVVHSLDRWSRNLAVTLSSFKQLSEQKIAFCSITENIDYTTPEGRLFIAMLGSFAQYYSDALAKHTSKGLKERALNGLPNGDIPFGYRRNNNREIEEIPAELDAVVGLFNKYDTGNHSLASLANWLNETGFSTRNKRTIVDSLGKETKGPMHFTIYSVRWILHNPFYTGKIRYHNDLYPGKHRALISEELFERVQKRLKAAKSRSRSVSTSFRTYLLKGIARCVYCGAPLWAETSTKGYIYYREAKTAHSLSCPASGKTISGRKIEPQMDILMNSLVLPPSWREQVVAKIGGTSERESVLSRRKQIEARLKRLGKTYVDGLLETGQYNSQRQLLQIALDALVVPEEVVAIDAGKMLENLKAVWRAATLEERHKLITTMFVAVYVDLVAARSIVGIQPKPTFFEILKTVQNLKDNKITVVSEDKAYKIEPEVNPNLSTVMVETGESFTVPATRFDWIKAHHTFAVSVY